MNGKNKHIKGVIKEDKRSVEREAIETTRKISEKKVNREHVMAGASGVEVRSVSAPNRNARLTPISSNVRACLIYCIRQSIQSAFHVFGGTVADVRKLTEGIGYFPHRAQLLTMRLSQPLVDLARLTRHYQVLPYACSFVFSITSSYLSDK